MNAPLPKSTRDALIVTARAMLAPFRPQGDIDNAVIAMLATLEGGTPAVSQQPQDRILTAQEVAALLHRTPKTVRSIARRGLIRRIHLGTGQRAGGYSLRSVQNFLDAQTDTED